MSHTLFKLLLYVTHTPIGTVFFKLTKRLFVNRKRSKLGRVWWYGYIYYYAKHYDIEKLKKNNKGYRVVKKILPEFDWFKA